MSISFKPTTKDKQAIRNIIVDAWLDENQVRDMPDTVPVSYTHLTLPTKA